MSECPNLPQVSYTKKSIFKADLMVNIELSKKEALNLAIELLSGVECTEDDRVAFFFPVTTEQPEGYIEVVKTFDRALTEEDIATGSKDSRVKELKHCNNKLR